MVGAVIDLGLCLDLTTNAGVRYVTFQMAEVAVPRDLFRNILERIDGLRRPSPAMALTEGA